VNRGRRPAILAVGRVDETPSCIVITGWRIGICAGGCTCHRDPVTGFLSVDEDSAYGHLGLTQHRACPCCQPWSPAELRAILRDLDDIEALQHTS
jgi:hypothetical protein